MKPLLYSLLLASSVCCCQSMAQNISFLTQLCPEPIPGANAEAIAQSWTCQEQQRPLLQEKFQQLLVLSPAGLTITSHIGQPFQFQHNQVEGEQFSHYSFDGCTADEYYCIVFAGGWEWWQHLLLDRKTGQSHSFTGTLYISPDQKHLLELQDSRLSETFDRNIIKLYQLTESTPQLLLDLSDSDFGGHQPEWTSADKLILQLWYHSAADPLHLEYRNQLFIHLEGKVWKAHIMPKPGSLPEQAGAYD